MANCKARTLDMPVKGPSHHWVPIPKKHPIISYQLGYRVDEGGKYENDSYDYGSLDMNSNDTCRFNSEYVQTDLQAHGIRDLTNNEKLMIRMAIYDIFWQSKIMKA